MPTYEYKCDACDNEWEEFQSMKAKPSRKCPDCGKLKARRLISAGGGLIFKGSGFYLTDYRSDSYRKGAEAEKKSKESAASSSGESGKSKDSGSKASTGSTSTKAD